MRQDLGDKAGERYCLMQTGFIYINQGKYNKALDYFERALNIAYDLGDKGAVGASLNNIGIVHYNKGDYNKAAVHLEKSLSIQKEIGFKGLELYTTTHLYLSYKNLGKEYDINEIHSLIKDADNVEFELNFRLYQLLDDTSYLETAYKQVQDTASELEEETGKTFLAYPIPKAIVEDWEKVK